MTDIPEEAWKRVEELCPAVTSALIDRSRPSTQAFARYIMEKEGIESVDPLMMEAREICAAQFENYYGVKNSWSNECREGRRDDTDELQSALTALKRGIELGQQEAEDNAWSEARELVRGTNADMCNTAQQAYHIINQAMRDAVNNRELRTLNGRVEALAKVKRDDDGQE